MHLLTYLHSWPRAYKTGIISETVEDGAKATINGLYKVVHWLSIDDKMSEGAMDDELLPFPASPPFLHPLPSCISFLHSPLLYSFLLSPSLIRSFLFFPSLGPTPLVQLGGLVSAVGLSSPRGSGLLAESGRQTVCDAC